MRVEKKNAREIITINDELRLKRYDKNHDFALKWYQNVDTVYMVDGVKESYDIDKLNRMYSFLNENYELYFIEVFENGKFTPIGDVSFSAEDMPIVIGDENYRRKGIAKKVILSLVSRAKSLGFKSLSVKEIYGFNIASQRTFESIGFVKQKKTTMGFSYRLNIL